MRHAQTLAVLAVAREFAASAEGLTIDDMANVVNASRRSAERMRDAVEAGLLALLRRALLEGVQVTFDYGSPPGWRTVVPYGLLFGPRPYLVARAANREEPVQFRMAAIHDVELVDEPGAPPRDFDLQAFAGQSFGVFQEAPEDVALRFAPEAAANARLPVPFGPDPFRRTGRLVDRAFPCGGLSRNRSSPDDMGTRRDHPLAAAAHRPDARKGRRLEPASGSGIVRDLGRLRHRMRCFPVSSRAGG